MIVDLDVKDRFQLNPIVQHNLRQRDVEFGFEGLGAAVFYRCVVVGTSVLTKDLRWVNVEELKIGDEIVGVDEYAEQRLNRKLRTSIVEANGISTDKCLRIETTKGSITVNYEHPFLVKNTTEDTSKHDVRWSWVKAKDLTTDHAIAHIGSPWESEDGNTWLAGMYDGEGSVSKNRLHMAQRSNGRLFSRIEEELTKRDISFVPFLETNHRRNSIGVINVNGTKSVMKVLGTVRPTRLLDNWMQKLDKAEVGMPHDVEASVLTIVEVGEQQIVNLQTSTRTFISNGFVSHNTYARPLDNGQTEHWPDVVIRSVQGAMTILKWWLTSHHLPWDEDYWQGYAARMSLSAFQRKWLPPGRGLQVGGTDFVYRTGAMAHQNCGAKSIRHLSADSWWVMNALMHGVGIGFDVTEYYRELHVPLEETETFVVPDTREGWCDSVQRLIESYENGSKTVVFDYSQVRPAGVPIKGFGGVASGPEPLQRLHEQLRPILLSYAHHQISPVRLVADVINLVGTAVVAGGVRRTALICLGSPDDKEFLALKDYGKFDKKGNLIEKGPSYDRMQWGWTSNNSAMLKDHEDFQYIPEIAEIVQSRGEPGLLNFINISKYGRFTEKIKPDEATLINPCGEQPLEDGEVCCLAEVFGPNCKTEKEFYEACEFATTYASIITLLPTLSDITNTKIAKNRRIGVSVSGVAEWLAQVPSSTIINRLRHGYNVVRQTNKRHAQLCGVPESIRVTTVKPSGSISQLAGVSPGLHFPMYGRYVRRMRVQDQSPIVPILIEAGIPHEPDVMSSNTTVFEFPVNLGAVRGQREVSMWAKGALAVMMQRHWSDNATSVTVTFDKKKEGAQLSDFLAFTMPQLKSISVMPEYDPDGDEQTYAQLPYEEITLKEYEERKSKISSINWNAFQQTEVEAEIFCDGDTCIV